MEKQNSNSAWYENPWLVGFSVAAIVKLIEVYFSLKG